ncbi:replication protein [Citrobacter freundii]|uniref:replication protein n=1 Tax=Citrobacter freundii TaxID=546 RepID=UPI001BCEE8DB|nr:replication protein [Citrobacter freundii]
MANIARVYNFPGADSGDQESRVAELDDGYTRIANELLESIASADLTARQLKLMLAYIRKTYGFNKKSDRIADEQIAQITGLSRQNVNKAKKELLSMNCLFLDGSKIGVNKEVSAWRFSKCLQVSNFVSKSETRNVSKLETNEVSKLETHKRHSLKTNKDNINNPPIVPQSVIPPKPEKTQKRATQFPKDFTTTEGNLKLATELGVDLQSEVSAFSDHHQSKGSTFKDWNLALNTWLRNAAKFGRRAQPVARTSSRPLQENFGSKDYGTTEIPAWARD